MSDAVSLAEMLQTLKTQKVTHRASAQGQPEIPLQDAMRALLTDAGGAKSTTFDLGAQPSTSLRREAGDIRHNKPKAEGGHATGPTFDERLKRCFGLDAHGTMNVSLSASVQVFLLVSLFLLVTTSALLFNNFALVMINRVGSTYLGSALSQAVDVVEGSLFDVRSVAIASSSCVLGDNGASTSMAFGILSNKSLISFGPGAGAAFGMTTFVARDPWDGLTHVYSSMASLCRTLRRTTQSALRSQIRLMYSIQDIGSSWNKSTVAFGCAGFSFYGSFSLVQPSAIPSARNDPPSVGFIFNISSGKVVFLQQGTSVPTNVVREIKLWEGALSDVFPGRSISSYLQALDDELRHNSVDRGGGCYSRTLLDRTPVPIGADLHEVLWGISNTSWRFVKSSNSSLTEVSVLQQVCPVESSNATGNCMLSIVNVSGQIFSWALSAVNHMSEGTSVELADEGDAFRTSDSVASSISVKDKTSKGSVLAWSSSLSYYIPLASFVTSPVLCPWGADTNLFADFGWTVIVDTGASVVASLGQGTNVVIVVTVCITLAVCISAVIVLRLLLGPLAKIKEAIQLAAALRFRELSTTHVPPTILKEIAMINASFLHLVVQLNSYRGILLDAYETGGLRARGASVTSMSLSEATLSTNASMISSGDYSPEDSLDLTADSSFGSSSKLWEMSSSSSTFAPPDDSSNNLHDELAESGVFEIEDETLSDMMEHSRGGARLSLNGEGSEDDDIELPEEGNRDRNEDALEHLIKVELRYISRRHKGKQRHRISFEYSYRDGDPQLYNNFLRECLKSLKLSPFEEVSLEVHSRGIHVRVRTTPQLEEAMAGSRGELQVRIVKTSVKKILSPFALLVDLTNFALNIALIVLVFTASLPGTAPRLSISVFCGFYFCAFFFNLLLTLWLLKRSQREPLMKEWLSQAGLEVSIILLLSSLNTQHLHFLWSQWSLGLKFNAPRSLVLWRRAVKYSLFGFVFLDSMQVIYKAYRVIGQEGMLELTAVSLLTSVGSVAMSMPKRWQFVRMFFFTWRNSRRKGEKVSAPPPGSDVDETGAALANGESSGMTRQRAGLSQQVYSEDVTVMLVRLHLVLPDSSHYSADPKLQTTCRKLSMSLNYFLTTVFGTVRSFGGHVLFHYGNEAACIFNAPKNIDQHTLRAARCAFAIQKAFELKPQKVHVALIREECVLGTLGSKHRKNFQCFASWDSLRRMLDFAESAEKIAVVCTLPCWSALSGEGSSLGGLRKTPGQPSSSNFRATMHEVMSRESVVVELTPIRRRSVAAKDFSLMTLLRGLRCFGVVVSPSACYSEACRVVSTYGEWLLKGSRTIPPEEDLVKLDSATTAESPSDCQRRKGSPGVILSTESTGVKASGSMSLHNELSQHAPHGGVLLRKKDFKRLFDSSML